MERELIKLFEDSRVPRYTSYPTAPHFQPDPSIADRDTILAGIDAKRLLSLYLHVPFCHQLCWYCGCTTKVVNTSRPVERYIDLLQRELDIAAHQLNGRPTLGHIHWGGGTPSIVGGTDFELMMRKIGERFPIDDHAEIAIELDPRNLDADMIAAMAVSGINRASFGIQSFDPEVQSAINRIQPFSDVQRCVFALRRAGIDNLSFDLLYGLPHQTRANCIDTVEKALVLNPQRLAVFAYAHLPARIKHQRLIPEETLPQAEERVAQYEAIRERLLRAGYVAIGIDHFAMPNDSLAVAAQNGALRRNFQGYTADHCDQLLGLGASAITSTPSGYLQNHPGLPEYAFAILDGRMAVARGLKVGPNDIARRAAIEAIMCYGEVDLGRIAQQCGIAACHIEPDAERIDQLLNAGLIERENSCYRMADDRQPFVRLLAACFDIYLNPQTGQHAAAL